MFQSNVSRVRSTLPTETDPLWVYCSLEDQAGKETELSYVASSCRIMIKGGSNQEIDTKTPTRQTLIGMIFSPVYISWPSKDRNSVSCDW